MRQGITPQAITLYKAHDAVVLWATPVEIASALARLMRMKQLDSRAWAMASKLAKKLADSWSVIQPSDALRAMSIPEFLETEPSLGYASSSLLFPLGSRAI